MHVYFRQKKDPINAIRCHPIDGSPTKPKNLSAMELESIKAKVCCVDKISYYIANTCM